jgi:hypothetical protein
VSTNDLPGSAELRALAPGQSPTHEAVRSDGVVVARGSLDRLTDLVEWLNATPVGPETFSVRPKQRTNNQKSNKTKESHMKVMVEKDDEGLLGLVGKQVTLLCTNYFYTGKLVGVNDTQVKLEDPAIVYETGAWDKAGWADAQKLPAKELYVRLASVEAYGVLK